MVYQFVNNSNVDIVNLRADFVLCIDNKPVETYSTKIATKDSPLFSNVSDVNSVNVKFKRKIFTKKELENYTIKIYLYKDDKYKTLVRENLIPKYSF